LALFLAVFSIPAFAHKASATARCAAASALQSPVLPGDIAVKIDPQIEAPATEAMNFWASKLGFRWHRDSSPQTCMIDIEYVGIRKAFINAVDESGHILGAAALPWMPHFVGAVYIFNDKQGRYAAIIGHELGHVFSFEHSASGIMQPNMPMQPNWSVSPAEISQARAGRVRAKLTLIARSK
jgi:hypothetical protein